MVVVVVRSGREQRVSISDLPLLVFAIFIFRIGIYVLCTLYSVLGTTEIDMVTVYGIRNTVYGMLDKI